MGAKTWIVVHSSGNPRAQLMQLPSPPALDEGATTDWVMGLFPQGALGTPQRTNLSDTAPPEGSVVAGRFAGVSIVMSTELAIDRPSELPARFIAPTGTTVLHASHSVVDWLAFAIWQDGQLLRALSVSPDSGVIEDQGQRQAFEGPFWAGAHPAVDPEDADAEGMDYPLPFHPLDMSDAALRALLGFAVEGAIDPNLLDPDQLPLLRFDPAPRLAAPSPSAGASQKPWWRLW